MATDDKYDRQTRLWGGHGQHKLVHSHIIMLGSSSYGSETLKNLVLPGVGRVTIIDDVKVTNRDFGNDFLVKREHLGKNKAQALAEMLAEMNPDTKTDSMDLSVTNAISQQSALLLSCQMIIACDVNQLQASQLSDLCESKNISLMILRQYGLLGYLRVFKKHSCIIETRKGATPFKRDLHLNSPWPELLAFANRFDFMTMDINEHIHTPYVCILLQALQRWKAEHDG